MGGDGQHKNTSSDFIFFFLILSFFCFAAFSITSTLSDFCNCRINSKNNYESGTQC